MSSTAADAHLASLHPPTAREQDSANAWCRLYHEARGVHLRMETENASLRAKLAQRAADPHVAALCDLMQARSAVGLAKYGTDLTRTDLTPLQWLQHMREELADAALYCGVLAAGIERMEAANAQLRADLAAAQRASPTGLEYRGG